MNPIDLSNHPIKPHKIVDYKARDNLLGRHVKWLREDNGTVANIFKGALVFFESLLLAATGIGLIFFAKAINLSFKLQSEEKFNDFVAEKNPPAKDLEFELKTDTQTFNHTHEFVIEDAIVWVRHRHTQNAWEPLYFDGFRDGKAPISMDCDGANLVVLDSENYVHYKKIIREYRAEEIAGNKTAEWFTEGVALDGAEYVAIDKVHKNNWKDKWFCLPVIHYISNLIRGKLLQLPADCLAWAISHRGRYNNYIEDTAAGQHRVEEGVTTLYALESNKRNILKYDPWSPKVAKMNIAMPQTTKSVFEAEKMSVSASTIMVIGYEITQDPSDENMLEKRLTIKTKLADIDSEGWNPGLTYDYFKHDDDPLVRVIPSEPWIDHPLKLAEGAQVTNHVTIVQTGEGNDERELRLEGWNANGKRGIYHKKITEKDWEFREDLVATSSGAPLMKQFIIEDGVLDTTIKNYDSIDSSFYHDSGLKPDIVLDNFGLHSYDSNIILDIDGKHYSFLLHKKKTLGNFLGYDSEKYDFVIPKKYHDDPKIKELFSDTHVVPVTVEEKNGQLTLKSDFFKFVFGPAAEDEGSVEDLAGDEDLDLSGI